MKSIAVAASVLLALSTPVVSANLLVNSGFEEPITADGPPFIGFWEGFNGDGATAANSTLFPRTGAQSLQLSINSTPNTFAGAFQDALVAAGIEYVFSGYHATPSSPFDVGVELRIEWRNSVSNTEVSRTPNSTPIPTDIYTPFSLTATAPAGADTARLVYAIQSFGPELTDNGIAFVDDVSFEVIPEPSSLSLLAVGAAALALMRRRRS